MSAAAEYRLVVLIQRRLGSPRLDRFFTVVSALGRTPFYVAACLILLVIAPHDALVVGLLIIASEAVNAAIKAVIKRPRPYLRHADIVNKDPAETGTSFPSCHTQNVIIFWGYVLAHAAYPWVLPVAVAVGGVTILSRLYLGLHYPSDILAGAVIGSGILSLAIA